MTTFVNAKRQCRTPYVEGFGEYQTRWYSHEIECHRCKEWTVDYGDISEQVGDDPNVHAWICQACVAIDPELRDFR